MRVLVIGGTGFLGPFVVDELLRRRHEVAVLSRAEVRYSREVPRFAGDASNPEVLREVAHTFAPEALIDLLHRTPEHAQAVAQVFGGRLERSVHVSCTSVYGARPVCPVDEQTETVPLEQAPPQVASQIRADQVVAEERETGRLPGTIVRLASLYGPRHPQSPEWFFVRRVLDGRTRLCLPDGGLHICHRGFIQNMAWGVVQALTTKRAVGETYNLGEEKLYTLAQLAEGIARALGHSWELYSVPGHLWTVPYACTSFCDLHKARAHLRYRDQMIPRDGLEITVAYLVQNPPGDHWTWPGISGPFDYEREDSLIATHGVLMAAG